VTLARRIAKRDILPLAFDDWVSMMGYNGSQFGLPFALNTTMSG
jgi:hypothetical protein